MSSDLYRDLDELRSSLHEFDINETRIKRAVENQFVRSVGIGKQLINFKRNYEQERSKNTRKMLSWNKFCQLPKLQRLININRTDIYMYIKYSI